VTEDRSKEEILADDRTSTLQEKTVTAEPLIVSLGLITELTGNRKGRQYRDNNKDSERQ
jgi:hypothetical protein